VRTIDLDFAWGGEGEDTLADAIAKVEKQYDVKVEVMSEGSFATNGWPVVRVIGKYPLLRTFLRAEHYLPFSHYIYHNVGSKPRY
jgi:hypothetical protein